MRMTKQDCIDFLEREEASRSEALLDYWKCCSDDKSEWKLHRPAVDWVEDELKILEDGTVKIYEWLSGTLAAPTVSFMSYEDFFRAEQDAPEASQQE